VVKRHKKAIEITPQFAPAYYYLGLAYINTGQKDEAIKYFRQVLKVAPDTSLADEAKQSINKLTKKNE